MGQLCLAPRGLNAADATQASRAEAWVVMELAELGSFHAIVKAAGPLAPAEAGQVDAVAMAATRVAAAQTHARQRHAPCTAAAQTHAHRCRYRWHMAQTHARRWHARLP